MHRVQEDSSLTRSDAYFLDLRKRADYVVTGSAVQRNFPKGLYKASVALSVPYYMIIPSTCIYGSILYMEHIGIIVSLGGDQIFWQSQERS